MGTIDNTRGRDHMRELTVYLEEDRYNHVTDCCIPGAWVVELDDGSPIAFARPDECADQSAAEAMAQRLYG